MGSLNFQGVPGDFNLELLDYIYQVDGLDMVCNANELNAAYAADGYARVKDVPGVFVTTHGVGELSALNGVMGSLSERQRVIHVVGQTLRKLQDNHMMIHHSVGTHVDHQVYNKMSKFARLDAAELWDAESAPAEIDVSHHQLALFFVLTASTARYPQMYGRMRTSLHFHATGSLHGACPYH